VASLLFSKLFDVFSFSVVSSQKPDTKPVMDSPALEGHFSSLRGDAVQKGGRSAHEVKHSAED